MSEPLTFLLSYPPTANNLFVNVGKRRVPSAKYKSWKDGESWSIKSRMVMQKPVCGPYTIIISAGRPDKRRRDIDNIIKPISDALVAGGAVSDDSLCQEVTARWCEVPGVSVVIFPIREATP
jgi:crossover junction endodeoxyribonuclease RusA